LAFNFRLFFRLTYRSLFRARGTHARWTPKRVVFLVGFYLVFVPWQLLNWFCFVLDDVLFPDYRDVAVREPVFIVGSARTGSTHLLRVLARDEEAFACAKLWELMLAPSITQRKVVRALARLDGRLGNPVQGWLAAWQQRAFQEADQYHTIRFDRPDEDEFNFVPIFSAIHLGFPFPFMDELVPYAFFDSALSEGERARFMAFYRRAIQRTLYTCGPSKRYLSKSPPNSGRIGTLLETFPDAKFIYTVRDPAVAFPSMMSLFAFQWETFSDPLERYPFRDYMLQMTQHWYRHPLEVLEGEPEGRYVVVRYEDLVGDLEGTVKGIYTGLGLEPGPGYAEALVEELEKARRYVSTHEYCLEDVGMTREEIREVYGEVCERFGY